MRRYRRRLPGLRDDHGVAMLYVISLILVGVAALTPLSVAVVSETMLGVLHGSETTAGIARFPSAALEHPELLLQARR